MAALCCGKVETREVIDLGEVKTYPEKHESSQERKEKEVDKNDRSNGMSNFQTLVHLIKGFIGTGILNMPSAVKAGGLVVGPVVLFFFAVIAGHCMHLLLRCSHMIHRREKSNRLLSYGEIAKECCEPILKTRATWAKNAVNTFLVITQLGFCTIYFVFVSSTIVDVAGWDKKYTRVVIGIMIIPVVFISYIRSIKSLSYISVISNVLCIFTLVSIYQYLARNVRNPTSLPYFAGWGSFPIFSAMAIFAFEGIGVVLPLENKMKNPDKFPWILSAGIIFISTAFLFIGVLGYIAFGENVAGSVSLNLPDTTFYQGVKLTYAVAMFFTFFLQFYVPMEILVPQFLRKVGDKAGTSVELLFRTVMVLITGAVAIAIPRLDDVIALCGAFASSSLALIFPPLFHLLISHEEGGNKFVMIKDIIIMLIGFLGFLVGTYSAMANIIHNSMAAHHGHHGHHHNITMRNITGNFYKWSIPN